MPPPDQPPVEFRWMYHRLAAHLYVVDSEPVAAPSDAAPAPSAPVVVGAAPRRGFWERLLRRRRTA